MNGKANMLRYRAETHGEPSIDKLADLEHQRSNMKKANCVYRMAVKLSLKDYDSASINELLTISKNCELDYTTSLFKDAVNWKPAYAFERGPFGGYSLSNIEQRIARAAQ